MAAELLARVEVEPRRPAERAVVWLHGLGADGHDFEPLVPHLGIPDELAVRFVLPHAPAIPVTVNGGYVMPAWYDILEMDLRRRIDEEGARASAERITRLVEHENARGIPSERIILAGFSQGGAIAAHVALRHPERLGGLLLLSTYLVCAGELEAERSLANAETPIFQAHGRFDPVVPIERGIEARDRLAALGHRVEWHEYPMQHEVSPAEVRDLARWLRERLQAA